MCGRVSRAFLDVRLSCACVWQGKAGDRGRRRLLHSFRRLPGQLCNSCCVLPGRAAHLGSHGCAPNLGITHVPHPQKGSGLTLNTKTLISGKYCVLPGRAAHLGSHGCAPHLALTNVTNPSKGFRGYSCCVLPGRAAHLGSHGCAPHLALTNVTNPSKGLRVDPRYTNALIPGKYCVLPTWAAMGARHI